MEPAGRNPHGTRRGRPRTRSNTKYLKVEEGCDKNGGQYQRPRSARRRASERRCRVAVFSVTESAERNKLHLSNAAT
ncbi:hypothetical protein KFK09_018910 [Dendrobium nobile]|uniref:Uncharacterized protein n=1 Tax=Dendrobium nobile TaxID=94219 RepID=A0A8T3AX93_DENNO|nr:hypothetical protein KFK09_018910 [Dendrobium nobile]